MQEYAVMASRIRDSITEKANSLNVEDDLLIEGLNDDPE